MKKLEQLALVLLIFAGLNWGLWGMFEFNIVYYIFDKDWIARVIYVLLGVAGVYGAVTWSNFLKRK